MKAHYKLKFPFLCENQARLNAEETDLLIKTKENLLVSDFNRFDKI